ncbi:MAG: iron-sulfur cluster-binding protein [Lactobacillales bacterium]|jgi:L-lactate dehydrogenase complex protein LldF|nr:iron-sulfur cluster-binding protein [Lactobacillales bacterium]
MGLSISKLDFNERLEQSKEDVFMQKSVAKAQDAQWVKRESAREELGNWEGWRDLGEQMRQHVLDYLPDYLEQFSDNVAKKGGHVFFAKDAKEAREYVEKVLVEKKAKKVVKSKSMVTAEVDIDPMIEKLGLEVMETDLAEFILQEDNWDEPSHIVFPAIHMNRDQIKEVFKEKLGYTGDNEPVNLARKAREVMRQYFLEADVGITGCNFAIADQGTINLNTNEGNADLTIGIPKTHIVMMGMERIVPSIKEAEVLDNMLARSAVGQDITTYCTFVGPRETGESDGPDDFHVVIIDNGRSNALGTEFQSVLQCIRCGSCLNVCPVYRQIGGHGYGSLYPGPIGISLTPVLGGYEEFHDLPYACSLCTACDATCPVKIPLHDLITYHRKVMTDDKHMGRGSFQDVQMHVVGKGTSSPTMFKSAMEFAHTGMKLLSSHKRDSVENLYNNGGYMDKGPGMIKGWTDVRDLPIAPKAHDNFRHWYKRHEKEKGDE